MVRIAHLIFIIFLACFATKSWGYSYDAELLVPNSVEVAFEGQNQHYDDVSKYCYRCILSSDNKLQKKTQGGSFFAFEVGLVAAKGAVPSVRNILKQPFVQTQVRPNGSVNQLVNSRMLVVSENHLKDISKVFKVHNGKLNAFNSDYWKHVLPHRHVYTSSTTPSSLNANWRKTFQKIGAEKTTIWPWQ